MIDEKLIKELTKLGYEATLAYKVREDPDDPKSPVTKPVWAFSAPGITHYLSDDQQAQALIDDGKPLTHRQRERENRKIEKEATDA